MMEKGTNVMINSQIDFLETQFLNLYMSLGYSRIRLPTLHSADSFADKYLDQMYITREGLALRPETTIQSSEYYDTHSQAHPTPFRTVFSERCYRREKVTMDRRREFNQIGVEIFSPTDHEIKEALLALINYLDGIGLNGYTIGYNYLNDVRNYLSKQGINLMDVLVKIDKGELILPIHEIERTGPEFGIGTYNPQVVRGISYYTDFVFEVYLDGIQIGGGGQYNTPGGRYCFGFGLGLERIANRYIPTAPREEIYYLEDTPSITPGVISVQNTPKNHRKLSRKGYNYIMYEGQYRIYIGIKLVGICDTLVEAINFFTPQSGFEPESLP